MTDQFDEGGPARAWTRVDRRRAVLAAVATVVALVMLWVQGLGGRGGQDEAEAGPAADWPVSGTARDDVPADLLRTYQEAAETCGVPWPVLAAVGKVETNHDRETATSSAGAVGPMQFLPETWEAYQTDGDGDGVADVMNPVDAVYGAARLLCRNGAEDPATLRDAIWNYNRSDAYVDQVLEVARSYTTGDVPAG